MLKNNLVFISAGYDEGRMLDSKDFQREAHQRKIRSQKWVVGARSGNRRRAVQLYQVTGSDEWFPLNDLGSRI